MSGRAGRFEKQDQRRLDDNWMTGFDNKHQLHALAARLNDLQDSVASFADQEKQLKQQLKAFDDQLKIVEALLELEFTKIDLPSAEAELKRSQDRLTGLLDPNSDTSRAKSAYDAEQAKLNEIDKNISKLQSTIAVLEEKQKNAETERNKAIARQGAGLDDDEQQLASKKLPIASDIKSDPLDEAERDAARKVDEKLRKLNERVMEDEKRVVRAMEAAKREDTGALADAGSELEDVPAYLQQLKVLEDEALPQKLKRFLQYLNQSSDQGVTQLLAGLDEEVDTIEHRIEELNQTLLKVDFRAGRYLQLKPQRIKHERLRSLETAIRRLRGAALKDDEGESHYKALRDVVTILREAGENRRQQGSRALLDPRYRLEFYVVEVDRQTGDHSPRRSGSQSGSGGEKELMASHVLTASLSYALCPAEASRPAVRYCHSGRSVLEEFAFGCYSDHRSLANFWPAPHLCDTEQGNKPTQAAYQECHLRAASGKASEPDVDLMGEARRAGTRAMKSPTALRQKLRRQWEQPALRESRLLGGAEAWPLVVSIGKPKPAVIRDDLDAVKRHVQAWRQITVGELVWEAVNYRATAEPVKLPTKWKLRKPSEWMSACADAPMRKEFEALSALVGQTDSHFHKVLVRRRSLWRGKPLDEVLQAARLAMALEPGCADGNPLRTISLEGIDTKFFERHARLVAALLDARFDDEVGKLGLEVFLGALVEGDHWLLLVDLDGGLLPFRKQRVASAELRFTPLPGSRVLIVENESCQHQLPQLPDTVAVLGAGFDLGWTENHHLSDKQVAYWGDIDTWGLQFLAHARHNIAHLDALLMDSETYQSHGDAAVSEPVVAGTECPDGLTTAEQQLYRQLLKCPNGRLEQEFLPTRTVHTALQQWLNC